MDHVSLLAFRAAASLSGVAPPLTPCPGVLLCTDLAARGLDIPDVHWIVQLDPPQVRGVEGDTFGFRVKSTHTKSIGTAI